MKYNVELGKGLWC